MLIIDIIIKEMIMTDVHMTIIEIDDMIRMGVVAVAVEMIVVVIYVHYIFVTHVVNVLVEICVHVSRR